MTSPSSLAPIRVLIADDHPTMRQGLQSLLSEVPRITVVGTVRSFAEISDVLRQTPADVLLLDLLGMGESSIATVQGLRLHYPAVKMLIFSSAVGSAPELLKAGAHGYMTKEEVLDDLVLAIVEVHAGSTFLSQNVREYVDRTSRFRDFTVEERVILRLNWEGKGTNEIADYMVLSPGTIRNRVSDLYKKTDTTDRASLAAWYYQRRDEPS